MSHFDADIVRYNNGIHNISPDYIIISSSDQAILEIEAVKAIIAKYIDSTPILGISSGYRIICDYFGYKPVQNEEVMADKQAKVTCTENEMIFQGISNSFAADYCASCIPHKDNLPQDLNSIAFLSNTNRVIAVKHDKYPTYGIGVNSEFLFTATGFFILRNFLNIKDNAFTKQNMRYIRENIDDIDRQVVRLFSKRYGFVKEASKYKISSSDVIAKDRIRDVLNKVRASAQAENIDPDFMEKLYDYIVHSFISFEMHEYENKSS